MIAVGVASARCSLWPARAALYDLLAAPLVANLPKGATLIATSRDLAVPGAAEDHADGGFLLALPVVLYQVWAFVAPGLYSHEKKLVLPLVISSTLLFFIGVAFCYFFVFGQVFTFIQSFAPKSITAAPDIEAYLSFVLTMFIAFGVAFEVPIVVVVLARMGMVSIEKLKQFRGYFIVLAFIIAAVITPPDVVSSWRWRSRCACSTRSASGRPRSSSSTPRRPRKGALPPPTHSGAVAASRLAAALAAWARRPARRSPSAPALIAAQAPEFRRRPRLERGDRVEQLGHVGDRRAGDLPRSRRRAAGRRRWPARSAARR